VQGVSRTFLLFWGGVNGVGVVRGFIVIDRRCVHLPTKLPLDNDNENPAVPAPRVTGHRFVRDTALSPAYPTWTLALPPGAASRRWGACWELHDTVPVFERVAVCGAHGGEAVRGSGAGCMVTFNKSVVEWFSYIICNTP
jgi:hypothetical protein